MLNLFLFYSDNNLMATHLQYLLALMLLCTLACDVLVPIADADVLFVYFHGNAVIEWQFRERHGLEAEMIPIWRYWSAFWDVRSLWVDLRDSENLLIYDVNRDIQWRLTAVMKSNAFLISPLFSLCSHAYVIDQAGRNTHNSLGHDDTDNADDAHRKLKHILDYDYRRLESSFPVLHFILTTYLLLLLLTDCLLISVYSISVWNEMK